ncbi:hypothetical protein HELRODRAFT_173885 [Helobdella robusta]|uniref:Uncharacterized protein n=1 Tax=Helobdella robusta TaxID=6412 RepID=T1F7B9_HELRO|nr:hypothetical protein HELRODRAFT_173885 [Helobdella robusta]ESO03025.1 hypothetical protein HELRODRAFT_173885 [Helobdella robusta]
MFHVLIQYTSIASPCTRPNRYQTLLSEFRPDVENVCQQNAKQPLKNICLRAENANSVLPAKWKPTATAKNVLRCVALLIQRLGSVYSSARLPHASGDLFAFEPSHCSSKTGRL